MTASWGWVDDSRDCLRWDDYDDLKGSVELQLRQGQQEIRDHLIHDGKEQPVLAAIEAVDVGLRAADLSHDVVDADAIIASLEEHLGRMGAELRVALLAASRARGWRG